MNDSPLTQEEAERITWFDTGYAEYADMYCSEPDPFAPASAPMYWVPKAGGEVTADIFRELTEDEKANGSDPWDYDIPTGATLTPEQMTVVQEK